MSSPPVHSPNSPLIKASLPTRRRKEGIAYVEGERAVREGLRGCWRAEALFLSAEFAAVPAAQEFERLAASRGCQVHRANARALEKLSDCKTAPPCGLLVRPPTSTIYDIEKWPRRLLVMDRVQDPGNAGTLVRSAFAFGFSTVLTEGSVRLTNEKFLRSAAGICFHEGAVFAGGTAEALAEEFARREISVIVLDPHADIGLQGSDAGAEQLALVFGNEANGIDWSTWRRGRPVRIPIVQGVESLNVAASGAIALHHFRDESLCR